MVALEPDRYFIGDERLLVALPPGSDLAYAVSATWIEEVIGVLDEWGPVIRVEPSPVAVAATLPGVSGAFALEAGPDEEASLELSEGSVKSVRRAPATSRSVSAATTLPPLGELPGSARAAWGALRRNDDPTTGTLMAPERRSEAQRRRLRGLIAATLALVAGLAFLIAAADRSRERTLGALQAEGERLSGVAGPAIQAQERLALREREISMARTVLASRPDPGAALAAIGAVLPGDVVVLSARASARTWQLDGTSRDAAALIPLLDGDERFDSVRSRAPSTRFRDGQRTRESFAIAFDVR
jgi:hypothetical protein